MRPRSVRLLPSQVLLWLEAMRLLLLRLCPITPLEPLKLVYLLLLRLMKLLLLGGLMHRKVMHCQTVVRAPRQEGGLTHDAEHCGCRVHDGSLAHYAEH
jgi:hypothetical protein